MRTAHAIKECNFRKVVLAWCVVEKVHAVFGDKRGPLHESIGAVTVAFRQAVIISELGS